MRHGEEWRNFVFTIYNGRILDFFEKRPFHFKIQLKFAQQRKDPRNAKRFIDKFSTIGSGGMYFFVANPKGSPFFPIGNTSTTWISKLGSMLINGIMILKIDCTKIT